jgi:hypothetical protein
MRQDDRLRSTGSALETLQRWELSLSDELKDILEELEALQTESLVRESELRPRPDNSQLNPPDRAELDQALDELIGRVREHAARESDAHCSPWFGAIEQLLVTVGTYLDPVLSEADRILTEAAACRHPFNCRCQRQLKLFEERIQPALKIWDKFSEFAEALRNQVRRSGQSG